MTKPIITVYLMLAYLCSMAPVFGQSPDSPAPTSAGMHVNFDGGRLDKYVALLRSKFPKAKIVLDGVGDLELPEARLPNVTLREALEWIPRIAASVKRGVTLQPSRGGDEGMGVYVLTGSKKESQTAPPSDETIVRTYPLRDEYDNGFKAAEVRRAMFKALAARQAGERMSVEEGARFVTVTGTRGDITAADDAYDKMTRGGPPESTVRRLQTEIEKLREQLRARGGTAGSAK